MYPFFRKSKLGIHPKAENVSFFLISGIMDTSKGNDASQNCGQIDKEQEKSLCRPAVRILLYIVRGL